MKTVLEVGLWGSPHHAQEHYKQCARTIWIITANFPSPASSVSPVPYINWLRFVLQRATIYVDGVLFGFGSTGPAWAMPLFHVVKFRISTQTGVYGPPYMCLQANSEFLHDDSSGNSHWSLLEELMFNWMKQWSADSFSLSGTSGAITQCLTQTIVSLIMELLHTINSTTGRTKRPIVGYNLQIDGF